MRDASGFLFGAVMALGIVLLIFTPLILIVSKSDNQWAVNCEKLGGKSYHGYTLCLNDSGDVLMKR